jgi:hypothetical protein
MRKRFVWVFILLVSIVSFLSAQVQPEGVISDGQQGEATPEILMSTSSLGQGWQIYALNPDTGALRRVTNALADS